MKKNTTIWDHISLSKALSISIDPLPEIKGVSIDSKKIKEGDLFIGLKGEHHNGGVFAADAMANGAVAAIVEPDTAQYNSRPFSNKLASGREMIGDLGAQDRSILNSVEDLSTKSTQQFSSEVEFRNRSNIIIVPDAFAALRQLATYKRNNTLAKIVCITGSVAKTSTKEMMKTGLDEDNYHTFASAGNYNNQYGMPLSLANLRDDADCCILELGMNHKGEIAELVKIAKPNIAIITEVAPAHLEFFSSVEEIAMAKAEIFLEMKEDEGIAILNGDSKYYGILKGCTQARNLSTITFGSQDKCDVQLLSYRQNNEVADIKARCFSEILNYRLAASGIHFAINSLATLASAYVLGRNLNTVAQNLEKFLPITGRGRVHQLKDNIILIDDAYNANPASMIAAIARLGSYNAMPKDTRLIAVLGDMRELGNNAAQFHKDLADHICLHKIDKVLTVGDMMEHLFFAIPEPMRIAHHKSSETAAVNLLSNLKPNDILIIKGSLSMNMSYIVKEVLSKV